MTLGRQLQVLDLVEADATAEHRLARFDGRFWAIHRQAVNTRIPALFSELGRKLRHDHVATVLASGTGNGGLAYVVEEYSVGLSLREILEARKRFGPMEAARIVRGVSLGLGRVVDACVGAEAKTPRAVPLTHAFVQFDGKIKVCDPFRHLRGSEKLDAAYAAPEALSGASADPSSLIFSLGVVLWELCAGKPFPRSPRSAPPSLATSVPGFPQKLDDILQCASSEDPAQRFSTLEAFANALGSISERSTSELASCMQTVFEKQHAAQREWLAGAHQSLSIPPLVPSKTPMPGSVDTRSIERDTIETPALTSQTFDQVMADPVAAAGKTQPVNQIPRHMQARSFDGRYRAFADERPFLSSEASLEGAGVRAEAPAPPEEEGPTKPFSRVTDGAADKTEEMPAMPAMPRPALLADDVDDNAATLEIERVAEPSPSEAPRVHAPPSSLAPAAEPDASVIVQPHTPPHTPSVRPPLPLHAVPDVGRADPTVPIRRARTFQLQDVLLVAVTLAFLAFAVYTVFVSREDPPVPRPSTVGIPYAYPTDVPPLPPPPPSASAGASAGASASAEPSSPAPVPTDEKSAN